MSRHVTRTPICQRASPDGRICGYTRQHRGACAWMKCEEGGDVSEAEIERRFIAAKQDIQSRRARREIDNGDRA